MVNPKALAFKSRDGTAQRTWGARLADVVNVKDFGAKGDNSTDDGAALQAALDAAFGSSGGPHNEDGAKQNRMVVLPAGIYRTTIPLNITNVYGGRIVGAGMNATKILYTGGNGNGYNGLTTILTANFMTFTSIEDLTLEFSGSPASPVCFHHFKSPTFANSNAGSGNLFLNVRFKHAVTGCLLGYGTASLCSEGVFVNCHFDDHTWGLRVVDSGNALDHTCFGCRFTNCSTHGLSVLTGSAICMFACHFENNGASMINTGGDPCAILGCVSKDAQFLAWGGPLYTEGCLHDAANGYYAGSEGFGKLIADGCHSTNGKFQNGSVLYLRGSTFDNASYLTGYSGTVGQNI